MTKHFELTCLACDLNFRAEMETGLWEPNYCLNCGEPINLDDGYEDDNIIEELDDDFYPEEFAD